MTVDTMNITSRQKVFEVIRKHQLITVSELNQFLEMTPANIRHHLAVLIADGMVEKMDVRNKIGRGRPETVYSVSNVFVEDGLDNLLEGILKLWFSSLSPSEMDQKMKAIARHLAGGREDVGVISVTKRLTSCVIHLNSLGYKAQWEASPTGPRVKFGVCPYSKIIKKHPELCEMDEHLLETLLGFKMSQISKLERDERAVLFCSFIGH